MDGGGMSQKCDLPGDSSTDVGMRIRSLEGPVQL